VCLATSDIARTIDMFLSHRDKAAAKEMYLFYQGATIDITFLPEKKQ
jgi:hypothetical protein